MWAERWFLQEHFYQFGKDKFAKRDGESGMANHERMWVVQQITNTAKEPASRPLRESKQQTGHESVPPGTPDTFCTQFIILHRNEHCI